eukprot:comp19596_c1_seq1/m.23069 comp19596_c1_seq1/g.23069  ORF comp19596_c1_seq1/g.23069 comp19596_c1_seq1/m.23069 type:complete len:226 (-) comp19596_c1_seq1:274-951(-)
MAGISHEQIGSGSDNSFDSPRRTSFSDVMGHQEESAMSIDDLDDFGRLSRFEQLVTAANAILHSRTYFVVYILMILLSLTTVVWTFVDPSPDEFVFWVIEAIIILVMFGEMCFKLLAMGVKNYVGNLGNLVDVFVLVLVLVTLGMYAHTLRLADDHKAATVERDIGLVVYIFRNVAQILRVIVMIKNQSTRSLGHKDVDMMRIRLSHDTDPLTAYSPAAAVDDNY